MKNSKALIISEQELFDMACNVSPSPSAKNAYALILIQKGDFDEAISMFIRAANEGSRDAMFNLAMLYHDGLYVDEDFVETEKWLKSAAKLGDEDAKYLLENKNLW